MRGNRSDLVLTVLLSVLAHYAVFTVIPLRPFRAKRTGGAPLEIEIREGPMPPTAPPPSATAPPIALPHVAQPAPDRVPPAPRPRPVRPPRERRPEEERAREVVKTEPHREHQILQSVDQPNQTQEDTPQDPHFLAQANRDVREETVARTRSLTQNDPDPGGSRPNPSHDEQAGTDEQEAARENEDRPGVREPDSATASPSAPPSQTPQPGGDGRHESPQIAAVPDVPRVDRRGLDTEGPGSVETPTPQHQPGHEGTAGQQGGRGQGHGLRLQLSWTQFEGLVGEGELRRQREEAAERRRSRTRGRFAGNWERIRAAMENYVPDVRVGNQTALRAAASPFAVYLTQLHRRLHRLWAEGYLVDLANQSEDNPLNDFTLVVNLEIVINPDGSVHKVGVIDGGSGSLVFDAAAVDVVYRSAPHPSPPHEIVSGDGRTYLHWAFYRNHRQCGTFNAEPFILPNPPSMPRDQGIGLPDVPRPPAPAHPRPASAPDESDDDADHEDTPTPAVPLGGSLG